MRFLFIAALFFCSLSFVTQLRAQSQSALIDGAKKEGKLVAYVSMLTENATALLAEFKKKYPFIDTSLYRANTQKLLPKIQLEARTRQHEADVISATFTIWNELTRGKLFATLTAAASAVGATGVGLG